MSTAFFLQKVVPGVKTTEVGVQKDKTIASLELPFGSYVIIAKFEVAVLSGADNDLKPRISRFGLAFGGHTDHSWCHLQQGGLDTVVLTIAGTNLLSPTAHSSSRDAIARLFCVSTNDDLEIKDLAITAIPVDAISA